MKYRQITSEERYMLSALKQQGLNQSEIARSLGRHRSTISRELQRNSSRWDSAYRPSKAQERTNGRRSRSRRNQRFDRRDWTRVKALLRQQWSPEQVSESLRKSGELSISHETIYRYIWRDRWAGGFLYRDLRQVTKSRRKRYSAYDSRGRLAGKRHISERPQSVEHRNRIGHWEIDTVVGGGSKDCVVTLVERKTGYAFVGKLRDRSMFEMTRRLKKLIARAPEKFKTITSDNGSEFHDYESVEDATGVKFYFATPYHSWERGSSENFNGLLRQYLPKRACQAKVTQRDCDAIAKKLNTRPRKRLGYRTPEECFNGS